ncbi:hypothetical protein WGT02_26350 (plasmid) [Rhizobium sp. T1470]|uniref:hypothetical protein n=1 Tax=unclassified Rhizobium TaxID=2613769 RepID=UPI0030D614CA
MAQPRLAEQGIIDRQNGATWITEQDFDALIDQCPHHHLCACHFLVVRGQSCRS